MVDPGLVVDVQSDDQIPIADAEVFEGIVLACAAIHGGGRVRAGSMGRAPRRRGGLRGFVPGVMLQLRCVALVLHGFGLAAAL